MVGRLTGLPRPLGGRGEDPGRRWTGDPAEGEGGAETRARGDGGVLKLVRDLPRPREILAESDLWKGDLAPGLTDAV